MFGQFDGPLPEGEYVILTVKQDLALTLPNIVNETVVTLAPYVAGNPSQTWQLTYGEKGYRFKNTAWGNYLSYPLHWVPNAMVNCWNAICGSDAASVEWYLTQRSLPPSLRLLQLRLCSGPNLHQETQNIGMGVNSQSALGIVSGPNTYKFIFQPVSINTQDICPNPLNVTTSAAGFTCIIHSAFNPRVALDIVPGGTQVLTDNLVKESTRAQVWKFVKSAKGYKIQNCGTQAWLGFGIVPGTPALSHPQNQTAICEADDQNKAVEWELRGPSTLLEYELRLGPDSKNILTIWNAEPRAKGWVHLEEALIPPSGTYLHQRWIFMPTQ